MRGRKAGRPRLIPAKTLPYSLPSRLVNQTQDSNYVPLDTQLIAASHRDYPDKGTFLLVTPVYNDVRKTDFLVFELDLDALVFADHELRETGFARPVVGDQQHATRLCFRPTTRSRSQSLLDKMSLATVFSFREASIDEYNMGSDNRLAVISPDSHAGQRLRRDPQPRSATWPCSASNPT